MQRKCNKGFTLVEMLLVLVIVSSFIYMGMQYFQLRTQQLKIDKTAAQMQQILNAALSYYVANGAWPQSMACLRADSGSGCSIPYLAPTLINNPYNSAYAVAGGYAGSAVYPNFFVFTGISAPGKATSLATSIVGKLPMGQTGYTYSITPNALVVQQACAANANDCLAIASVNIPGQNLNNAGAVNFAGLYHHGGCVPVPSCPVDATGTTMTPQIMVVPVSVSGTNDPNSSNVYPISSFTAYASGGPAATPAACANGTAAACTPVSGSAPTSGTYWRVCLQVVTEKGDVSVTNTGGSASASYPYYPWGGNVTLMAITRCVINNEPSGSTFSVFTQ